MGRDGEGRGIDPRGVLRRALIAEPTPRHARRYLLRLVAASAAANASCAAADSAPMV